MTEKSSMVHRIVLEVFPFLPYKIKNALLKLDKSFLSILEEIRVRAERPVILQYQSMDGFLHEDGKVLHNTPGIVVTSDELEDMVYRLCDNSWYAYQEDINRGFITIRGGHRIGLVGTPVIEEGKIINIRDISSLNIRLAREVIGCGEVAVKYMINGNRDIYNTLIVSPPGCGKTTLLRDMIRSLSNGFHPDFFGVKVGVVDERGEIAACYGGIPQNDLGYRTDIINGMHKKSGIERLLRSMSPHVIAMDELGNPDDVSAILQIMNAGVRMIGTVHGYDVRTLATRHGFKELLMKKVFERFVVLSMDSFLQYYVKILDGDWNVLAVDNQSIRKSSDCGEFDNNRICVFPTTYGESRMYSGNTGVINGTGE